MDFSKLFSPGGSTEQNPLIRVHAPRVGTTRTNCAAAAGCRKPGVLRGEAAREARAPHPVRRPGAPRSSLAPPLRPSFPIRFATLICSLLFHSFHIPSNLRFQVKCVKHYQLVNKYLLSDYKVPNPALSPRDARLTCRQQPPPRGMKAARRENELPGQGTDGPTELRRGAVHPALPLGRSSIARDAWAFPSGDVCNEGRPAARDGAGTSPQARSALRPQD